MSLNEGRESDLSATSTAENQQVEEWKPSLGIATIWTLLTFVLTVLAFILFAYIYTVIGGGSASGGSLVESQAEEEGFSLTVRFGGLLPLIVVSVGVLLLHEAIHAAGFWYYGGRPKFGAGLVHKVLPVLYCTSPGDLFTRSQFSVIILGPLVVISLLGVAAMPFTGNGIWLIVPMALNFGGAIGDIWMFGVLLRRGPGTMIEDRKDGLRFHFPAAA